MFTTNEQEPRNDAGHSLSDLLRLHEWLDALFLEHQRALLHLDLNTARDRLEEYENALLAHMRDEEELLIPIYAARAEAPLGGAPEIFRNEHEKLRQYVALFKAELPKVAAATDPDRHVIWLLDSQTTFKRLLVHHDTRERKMLYPALDDVTSERERERLWATLHLRPRADFGLLDSQAETQVDSSIKQWSSL